MFWSVMLSQMSQNNWRFIFVDKHHKGVVCSIHNQGPKNKEQWDTNMLVL